MPIIFSCAVPVTGCSPSCPVRLRICAISCSRPICYLVIKDRGQKESSCFVLDCLESHQRVHLLCPCPTYNSWRPCKGATQLVIELNVERPSLSARPCLQHTVQPDCLQARLLLPSYTVWLAPCRVPEECPQEIANLIAACRSSIPGPRPSAQEVLETLMGCCEPGSHH